VVATDFSTDFMVSLNVIYLIVKLVVEPHCKDCKINTAKCTARLQTLAEINDRRFELFPGTDFILVLRDLDKVVVYVRVLS